MLVIPIRQTTSFEPSSVKFQWRMNYGFENFFAYIELNGEPFL